MNQDTRPTPQAYADWQKAFDYFNQKLWDGRLPDCIITLRNNNPKSKGYYSAKRFASPGGVIVDEIAINSGFHALQPVEISLSSLAHEMTHGWQQHFGTISRQCYHNGEWADEMERIGLCPSATGLPGGRRTGQQMTHYIIQGGLFDTAVKELVAGGFVLNWMDRVLAMEPEQYQTYLNRLARDAEASSPRDRGGADPAPRNPDPISAQIQGTPSTPAEPAGRPKKPPPAPSIPISAPVVATSIPTVASPSPAGDEGAEPEKTTFLAPSLRRQANGGSAAKRLKFVCPVCEAAAWGKPTLKLLCGDCQVAMPPADPRVQTSNTEEPSDA